MRVPIAEYVALILSSGLGDSASGPPSAEVAPLGVTALNCWASSSGAIASFGPLHDLRLNANTFCDRFATNSSGRLVFGWQSAIFVGHFANRGSCLNSFNTIITNCYGTNPTRPATLGGTITDPGGANLALSFGTSVRF